MARLLLTNVNVNAECWSPAYVHCLIFYKLIIRLCTYFMLLERRYAPVVSAALVPITRPAKSKRRLIQDFLLPVFQVSYASGSPKFEYKWSNWNTYRTAPSSASLSKAKAAFINYFGWKRVAILHQYYPGFCSAVRYYFWMLYINCFNIICGYEHQGSTLVHFCFLTLQCKGRTVTVILHTLFPCAVPLCTMHKARTEEFCPLLFYHTTQPIVNIRFTRLARKGIFDLQDAIRAVECAK